MKNIFSGLFKVKSIITIVLTAVFAYMAVKGEVSSEQFMTIFATVIAFYFGTQSNKND